MTETQPMPSAKIEAGRYAVLGTSTDCEIRQEGDKGWRIWVLYSNGERIEWKMTKRALLQFCQEHPEL